MVLFGQNTHNMMSHLQPFSKTNEDALKVYSEKGRYTIDFREITFHETVITVLVISVK